MILWWGGSCDRDVNKVSEQPNQNSRDDHNPAYVPPGMPTLEQDGPATSYFEFWPLWLMYLPVVVQWLLLAVRYRSLTLPLIANPAVPLSGMVGVPKSRIFALAGEQAKPWILPWAVYTVTEAAPELQQAAVLELLSQTGLALPVVAKPDIGCRGAGVKLLETEAQLCSCLQAFPVGARLQLQRLSEYHAEAGVFYVRDPDNSRGAVTSLTLKYTPYVVGDGRSTLAQLVAADPRAGKLQHLYRQRHAGRWQDVIPSGQPYRLVFSASHCRGAVFRDGAQYIDPRLTATLDSIFADLPGFYYGRLDVKFRDLESLMAGQDFDIIEINGASSESINIWDRKAGLGTAVRTLLQQYQTLFKLGDANRRHGHKTPGIKALWQAWRYEKNLTNSYPPND